MSYRDLRNFSESMRLLGFPRTISMESFRTANFPLVEECVRWLAQRLDADAQLAGGHDTLERRVALVTHAVTFFLSRGNVRLNGARVYGADGWAVRELLKVTALLRDALDTPAGGDHAPGGDHHVLNYDVSGKLGEIKQARQLATEITAQGAFLHELLASEPQHKGSRSQALARPLDMSAMEAALRRALDALSERTGAARDQLDSVSSSEAALDSKLQRRRQELDRAEKRLRTVAGIKPAYQGELSSLEDELSRLWDQYVLRYRCVEALKHRLSLLENAQAELAEEQQTAIMQLIHKYETEDVLGKISHSDEEVSSSEGDEGVGEGAGELVQRAHTRLRIKSAAAPGAGGGVFGSMAGAGGARDSLDDIRDEDDSLSGSDVSDTQLLYSRESVSRGWRPRPATRPATRTLAATDHLQHLLQEGGEEVETVDSLGSSSESELRLESAAPAHAARRDLAAAAAAAAALSDNEF